MTYPSNVWASCRSLRRRPGAPGLSVQMFNVNRYRPNHLARNHPRKEPSPIRRPKSIYSSPDRYAHVKRPTGVQLPALYPINARFTPGRGTALLANLGDCYKRHAARIDMESGKSAATFTPTSAGTRVGAVKHPQRPYPSILMDWVMSPLRETQPRPQPLQRKVPTKANSPHRAGFCRGEYKIWGPFKMP